MIIPTQAPAASKLDAASRLAGGRLALLASLVVIVVLDLGLPNLDGREVVAGLAGLVQMSDPDRQPGQSGPAPAAAISASYTPRARSLPPRHPY